MHRARVIPGWICRVKPGTRSIHAKPDHKATTTFYPSAQSSRLTSHSRTTKISKQQPKVRKYLSICGKDCKGYLARDIRERNTQGSERSNGDTRTRIKVSKDGAGAFAVLLLTPHLIQNSLADKDFLPRWLLKTLFDAEESSLVTVAIAVVDQIPLPIIEGQDKVRPPKEFDGISIYATSDPDEVANLLHVAGKEHSQASHGTLTFQLTKMASALPIPLENGEDQMTLRLKHQISMPLPNTIFQNGREHTIELQTWRQTSETSSDVEHEIDRGTADKVTATDADANADLETTSKSTHDTWEVESKKQLSNILIPLYSFKDSRSSHVAHGPMCHLTPFRRVTASMGNVVSTFEGENEGTMPASKELEASLPRFLEQYQSSQPYEVWAEVVPKTLWLQSAQLATIDTLYEKPEPTALGHRFHRVLSGGGGWGSKQGLVALEPFAERVDSQGPTINAEDKQSFTGDVGDEEVDGHLPRDFSSLFQQEIQPGDVVRFWIVQQYNEIPLPANQRPQKPRGMATYSSYCFGSTAIEQNDAGERNEQSSQTINASCFEGVFGAMTRKPVSYTVELSREGQHLIGAVPTGTAVRTKLPPGSSFIDWPEGRVKVVRHTTKFKPYQARSMKQVNRLRRKSEAIAQVRLVF